MKRALFTFSKPNPEGVVATSRIAKFLENELELEIIYDKSIANETYDVLYIVGGAFAFCKVLPELGSAVEKAGRVVWIQNDYTIVPPKPISNAESPFRKAFRNRRKAGLPDTDMWTTVKNNSNNTEFSRYINWNSLTFEPQPVQFRKRRAVCYYGACRQNRMKVFDKYFSMNVPFVVSSPSKKLYTPENVELVSAVPRSQFYKWLGSFAVGLYIEDSKSHVEFHSPANRFYEMLGAKLGMVFQSESIPMLKEAGIDVTPWIADTEQDMKKALRNHKRIQREQFEAFKKPYKNILRTIVSKARKEIENA